MIRNRKVLWIMVFAIPLFAIFSQCHVSTVNRSDPRGSLYAGSSTCIKCHQKVYGDYLHTAHFNTMRPADEPNISGSFATGSNVFQFNYNSKVIMEKRLGGLYQVAYNNGRQKETQRFDITVGGVKAETYLYWKGNKLYQLPISYFKALHNWTNSPGYDSTFADFSRPVAVGCLECHASFAKPLNGQSQNDLSFTDFDKSALILSIDCERCHGPAGDHVYYQTTHPEDRSAQHIVTYATLTRTEKINMCAVCHSGGTGTKLRLTFGYKPNDNLTDYRIPDQFETNDPGKLDMHGNQSRLLTSSKCFINSNMDCATCHNVHKNERQQTAAYSQKCMDCHSISKHNFCPEESKLGAVIKSNCIDCHMPSKASGLISVGTSGKGKVSPYLVRNHRIAVYPDAAYAFIKNLKKQDNVP